MQWADFEIFHAIRGRCAKTAGASASSRLINCTLFFGIVENTSWQFVVFTQLTTGAVP